IDPAGRSGIYVTRPYGHGPPIVTGALLGIPGRGIARPVVHQVQLGIVRIPAPGGAAADLPLLALPGVGAGVRADGLAEVGGLLRIDQRVPARAHRIAAPDLLAVLDVIGGHRAANAELAARDADDHLVLEHVRRRGSGLALAGVAVLDRPHDLAGLGIQRD